MNDLIDELRASYAERGNVELDVDALIRAATTQGGVLRRTQRRRRSGAIAFIVVVVVLATTAVAIAARSNDRLRVATTEPSTASSQPDATVPIATTREFADLDRLLRVVVDEVDRNAQNPAAARAEVVRTRYKAFAAVSTPGARDANPDVPIYAVQVTGTTFVCRTTCVGVVVRAPRGTAIRIAWDPADHGVTMFDVGSPIDLSTLGRVYRIVLPDRPPGAVVEVCTQADLDGPSLPMPAPQRLTAPIVAKNDFARFDPPGDVQPVVSPVVAWNSLTRHSPLPASTGELFLAYYGSIAGPTGPQSHVLVWVLRLHHLAYVGFQGGPVLPLDTPTTQRPVCQFTDAYLVLDATTGAGVVDSYGG